VDRPAVADYPPGAGLPPRVIRDFEFVWMLRGRATFVVDEETLLTPGELLLVPPDVRHSFRWDHEQPSRHGYVHFGYADVGRAIAPAVRLTRMSDSDPLAGLCAYLLQVRCVPRCGICDTNGRSCRCDASACRNLLSLRTCPVAT